MIQLIFAGALLAAGQPAGAADQDVVARSAPGAVIATPAAAQSAAPAVPAASAVAVPQVPTPAVLVPQGTQLMLVTLTALSSRDTRSGQQIPLRVLEDVRVDGKLVIRGGSDAVGVVLEARDTGGMGVNGKLVIAPLYVSVGGETVRLSGGDSYNGKTKADAVIGLALSGVVSGRKATIPAGTKLGARVYRDIRLPVMPDLTAEAPAAQD